MRVGERNRKGTEKNKNRANTKKKKFLSLRKELCFLRQLCILFPVSLTCRRLDALHLLEVTDCQIRGPVTEVNYLH